MKVFVYGTLKPGECNYRRYCDRQVIDAYPAIAVGELFALPAGYPAMTAGVGNVYGFVLVFSNNDILIALDELEDYKPDNSPGQNLYQREEIEVFDSDRQSLGKVWAYMMLRDRLRSLGGIPIINGCWNS
ncbi:hypothetical protein BCD67_07365 [Oscillatoriales cyanobacterium USR001]|nr:hypothetical protein BCD67_07365 [Oscillatoriales cyanobacterium USR001]